MQATDIHDFLLKHADPSGSPHNVPVLGASHTLREAMAADDIEQLRLGPPEAENRWPVYLHRKRVGTIHKVGCMQFEPASGN